MKFIIVWLIFLSAPLLSGTIENNPKPKKLKILATNSIIGDWVKEVADVKEEGDNLVELTVIVGPDTDNHTFEPIPHNVTQLTKADIIFENGLGLEYWLDALYRSSESKAKRIPLSSQLTGLLPIDCHGHFKCCHAHHNEYDPHTWLNPNYAITMVQIITQTLIDHDPQNASRYKDFSLKYLKKLETLNQWIIKQVADIPLPNRKLVTNHDSFRYFAREYGFTPLVDILGSNSTENIEPSASQFVKLVKIIRQNDVPAIFGETTQNSVLVNKLAKEANLPQPKLLYTEALSKTTGPAKSYIDLMTYNVNTLVEGLK